MIELSRSFKYGLAWVHLVFFGSFTTFLIGEAPQVVSDGLVQDIYTRKGLIYKCSKHKGYL